MRMKRLFISLMSVFCILPVMQARIIYLNVEGSDWNDKTEFWVQLWQYPQEKGDLRLDSRKVKMTKVVDYVYAVEVGDFEHWTNLLFSSTNIIEDDDWTGKTIDLDLPEFAIDNAYSKNCFYTSSVDWHSSSAWGVQDFYLKHGWNNGTWRWRQLTHNGNGTYSLTAQYSGTNGCNYAAKSGSPSDTDAAAGQMWEGNNALWGYPNTGNTCTFFFNPLATQKISISRQFYLKHPWGGGGWTWSDALTDDGGGKFSIVKAWGSNGCNYHTSQDDTGSSWVYLQYISQEGSPSSGDICTFTYDASKSATTEGVITVTKAYYMKHNWGGMGLWLWEPLTSNGDGTYSIVKRWGNDGCNWNQCGRDNGNTWVPLASISVQNDDLGNPPNVGDFCLFTLNPSTNAITVKHLGHEMVDAETWNIYFTCGYDAAHNYYWGDDYKNGTGTVYAYMRRDGTSYENASWPGVAAKCCGQNEYGQYVYAVNKKIYDRVIFNNGKTTMEAGWRQTAEYTISRTPIGLFLDGWESTEGSSYNVVTEWNPLRAAEDLDDASKHYWICKNCDRYIHDDHDYTEGCLKCSRLDLDNSVAPSYAPGDYDKVNLTRTFPSGYGTVALPFAVTDVREVFGSGAYVARFTGTSKDENDEYVFNFVNETSMTANTPYIIYDPDGQTNPVFRYVTVVAPETVTVSPTGEFSMVSNYNPTFSMSGLYGVAYNRVIMRGGTNAKLKAYAGYLRYNRSGVPKIGILRSVTPDEVETNTIREVSLLIEKVLGGNGTTADVLLKVDKVLR